MSRTLDQYLEGKLSTEAPDHQNTREDQMSEEEWDDLYERSCYRKCTYCRQKLLVSEFSSRQGTLGRRQWFSVCKGCYGKGNRDGWFY